MGGGRLSGGNNGIMVKNKSGTNQEFIASYSISVFWFFAYLKCVALPGADCGKITGVVVTRLPHYFTALDGREINIKVMHFLGFRSVLGRGKYQL